MSAALHNRLRRVEKVWEARTEGQLQQVRRAALAPLSEGALLGLPLGTGQLQQVRRAALASLSDGDLRQLEGGDSLADRDPAVGRYRQAFDAAAMRLSGQTRPMGEFPAGMVAAEIAARTGSKLRTMFPDEGPYRRELYPRHMEFLAAGATFRERLFMAGNRTGKTETGAYELTCHLTGQYPAWWRGKR